MGIRVTIEGLDTLGQEFRVAGAAILRGAVRAVGEEVEDMARQMRRDAPVGDPGAGTRGDPPLAESIVTTHDGLDGTAGSLAQHAMWVEHGTQSRPARPFLLPAAERARRRFPRRVTEEVNEALR